MSVGSLLPYSQSSLRLEDVMDQDRTKWSAQEYADALNRAGTVADIRELAQEVNEKWGPIGELRDRAPSDEPAAA